MSTKVKGFLKGFKYISQIFDEKEEQFQIGLPTDVKHVAHIGSDDPSANAPSWMTEFKGGTKETSSVMNPNPEG
ncbi:CRIB domain-containing protein RIC1-like [Vigna umbellata]|nr:CRIB domain-containing protein RIC1-like [Vigna umbellata]